jgi:asparagine synthase (glutamine-hydrolysing)
VCGIVGFLQAKSAALSDPRQIVTRMTSTLRHRGEDHQGVWLDDAGILALGHRRLSIVENRMWIVLLFQAWRAHYVK